MPNENSLANQLTAANVGDVLSDDTALTKASHDAGLFEVRPQVVVAPRAASDVERLVRFANDHTGVNLTARSAGTDMTGGPLGSSIVVDFTKHFDNVLSVANQQAVTQPGVYYRDFERQTLKKGWLLPTYPASRELCTVGGMVANNAAGERTLTYGQTNQYIAELKVVLADGREHVITALSEPELAKRKLQKDFEGELYRGVDALLTKHKTAIENARPKVSKNSSGYALWNVKDDNKKTFDLTQLIAGSQGTLGLVTEITFTLVTPKKHRRMLIMFLPSFTDLATVALTLKQHNPETIESYDDKTLKTSVRFLPDLARELGANVFTVIKEFLPEVSMVLTGGVPKLVVMAEFAADTQHEANLQAANAAAALSAVPGQIRILKTRSETDALWAVRRDSFNVLRHKLHKLHTAPFIDDVIVPPAAMPEFLPKLYQLTDEAGLILTVAGHIGDGNFHFIPLMDIANPKTKQIIETLTPKVYELVRQYGGSMSAEHNDGLIRSPFLAQMFGPEILTLFQETKRIFDPKNIFNPGKKVGGNLHESLQHLRTNWD